MADQSTSQRGIEMIRLFEGCRLTAYRDSVDVLTIGVGHTGPDVTEGMVITQEQADALLRSDLARFEKAINSLVKVPLTQNQFDALASFTFNLGEGALRKSTLLKLLNAGAYNRAADEFLKWDRAGSKRLAGLTKRRQAERELFLEGMNTQ